MPFTLTQRSRHQRPAKASVCRATELPTSASRSCHRPMSGSSRSTVSYKAEYIWIDGTEPTARLRSKTKILADGADLPIWGFDGSSTNQAPGSKASDCNPQAGGPRTPTPSAWGRPSHELVMCEVLLPDMTPHATNTRAAAAARPRSSPTRSPCSASSRSTPSSRTAARTCDSPASLPRTTAMPSSPALLPKGERRRRLITQLNHRRQRISLTLRNLYSLNLAV